MDARKKATFGAGCFWGVEEAFRKVEGVIDTEAGFMGGAGDNPGYMDVRTGETGHAEVVQIVFDPSRVSYKDLLEVFWDIHDPTTPDRQGPDVGTQYRSAIFYHDQEQRGVAETSKRAVDASGRFPGKIVTEISPASIFWRAEEYHQRYVERRRGE